MYDTDVKTRRGELITALQNIGLRLRHDSSLCHAYISGSLGDDWSLESVVEECAIMHWLFTYTDYPIRCRQAYDFFARSHTDGRTLHEFITNKVNPLIKADTIAIFGIPEKWPWLTSYSLYTQTQLPDTTASI